MCDISRFCLMLGDHGQLLRHQSNWFFACSGNIVYEPGAVVCRMLPSWVRFGSIQLPAAQEENDLARQVADYVIKHHYSDLQGRLSWDFLTQLTMQTCTGF